MRKEIIYILAVTCGLSASVKPQTLINHYKDDSSMLSINDILQQKLHEIDKLPDSLELSLQMLSSWNGAKSVLNNIAHSMDPYFDTFGPQKRSISGPLSKSFELVDQVLAVKDLTNELDDELFTFLLEKLESPKRVLKFLEQHAYDIFDFKIGTDSQKYIERLLNKTFSYVDVGSTSTFIYEFKNKFYPDQDDTLADDASNRTKRAYYIDDYVEYAASDSHGSYGMKKKQKIDPYLLLAALGTAALLAFIAFRILVTTAAAAAMARFSDFPGVNDFMYLSDSPKQAITTVYNFIENAQEKFEEWDKSIPHLMNQLWKERKDDGRLSKSILSSFLERRCQSSRGVTLKTLFITFVSSLLGVRESGHVLDEVCFPNSKD